jgi:hypothetical protein
MRFSEANSADASTVWRDLLHPRFPYGQIRLIQMTTIPVRCDPIQIAIPG